MSMTSELLYGMESIGSSLKHKSIIFSKYFTNDEDSPTKKIRIDILDDNSAHSRQIVSILKFNEIRA